MSDKGDNALEWARTALARAPKCSEYMQAVLVGYIEGQELTIAFPVLESYANPAGSMQGGFITAAFDNVFGPLCLLATGTPNTTTIDIYTSYHHPIYPGDELVVTATLVTRGRTKVHMTARACNRDGKLIATATTNYLILNK